MRLILFDVDGTLLDARGAGARALMTALGQVFSRPFSRNGVPFAGRTDRAIVSDLIVANGLPAAVVGWGLDSVFQALPPIMQAETAQAPSTAYPGVLQLLQALRAERQLLLGLLTGNLRATADIKLRSAGIDPAHFSLGAYGDESADRDQLPPLALHRAAEILGKPADSAVVIGDTPGDISCAKAHGLCAVAVATGPFSTDDLAAYRPDLLLKDLTDTTAVMRALVG